MFPNQKQHYTVFVLEASAGFWPGGGVVVVGFVLELNEMKLISNSVDLFLTEHLISSISSISAVGTATKINTVAAICT